MRRRIVFVSTPVSPVGAGDGGGVETMLRLLTPALAARGHEIGVIAPAGSVLPPGIRIYPVTGTPPASATISHRDSQVIVRSEGILERMWEQALFVQREYDVVIATTYDWLSYYLTPFLTIPVLHWVTLASTIAAVDEALSGPYAGRPDGFVFYSKNQAASFQFVNANCAWIIPGAVDTAQFHFRPDPEPVLVWAARISPEKGLEDAVSAAQQTGMPLHVCGKIQDEGYWQSILDATPPGTIIYHGMLAHNELQRVVGAAQAMLVTPKWIEAFGLTVIEALACGTPVVAYNQGGPSEIIEDGKSGYLVPQDDVGALVNAVMGISRLRRSDARSRAENYDVSRMTDRVEEWIDVACTVPR